MAEGETARHRDCTEPAGVKHQDQTGALLPSSSFVFLTCVHKQEHKYICCFH